MLGKLLKYEFKATSRILLPMYIALIVFALINKAFMELNAFNNQFVAIPAGFSMFLYVMLIVAVFVITFIVTIQRFYKNLLGDEGYLMWTLPVSSNSLIVSKLIVSLVWYLISILLTFGSVFLLAVSPELMEKLPGFFQEVAQAYQQLGADAYLFTIEIVVLLLISLFCSVLMIYAAISIGQLFSRHRFLGSFAAFLGLQFVSQMLASILLTIFSVTGWQVFEQADASQIGHAMLIGIIVYYAVWSVAYYITAQQLLKNKLNLE